MRSDDTIVALSSGSVPSGVAIIRISGPQAGPVVEELLGNRPAPRRLSLAEIRLGGESLDRGLVAWMPGPHSFTGEDCVELNLHGSPAVVRAVLRKLTSRPGIRLAEAGEFTRRAFENGKLDLTEVEGLGDLIEAETENQRRQAVSRMEGGLSAKLEDWRTTLLDVRAEIEARLDFSDEGDVSDELPAVFRDRLLFLRKDFADAAISVAGGRIVREGLRVALAGLPNAGKSSLLNALANSDIAIVTDEPGTTRDVREVAIDLGGQLVVLVDMAGLRETESKAEAEGVRRAYAELERADLVLWLEAPDGRGGLPQQSGVPIWRILTKADLRGPTDGEIAVSSLTGAGVGELLNRLARFAGDIVGGGEPPLLSRERDLAALQEAASALDEALGALEREEFAAESLRRSAAALERLLGRMDAESVLDRLFSSFCIGK